MSEKKTLGAQAEKRLHTAVERLEDDRGGGKADACRTAIETGLRRLGYLDGGRTVAQSTAESVAVGVFHVGATLVLLSLFGDVTQLFAGIGALAGSLAMVGVSRVVIPRFEPGVTNRLPQIEVTRYGK